MIGWWNNTLSHVLFVGLNQFYTESDGYLTLIGGFITNELIC